MTYLLLLAFTFLPGFLVLLKKGPGKPGFKFILTFSGAYLLTLICGHLFPEIFEHSPNAHSLGTWVVVGLFGQMLLEGFTYGVEHGHMHAQHHFKNPASIVSGVSLLVALSIHALVEGTMLVPNLEVSGTWAGMGLLAAILVHKIPASIALASVMSESSGKFKVIVFLSLFALMSPIGLYLGNSLSHNEILSSEQLQVLYGLATGSLLYISMTIIFEARKDHGFRLKETLPALLGALLGITMVWVIG